MLPMQNAAHSFSVHSSSGSPPVVSVSVSVSVSDVVGGRDGSPSDVELVSVDAGNSPVDVAPSASPMDPDWPHPTKRTVK